MTMSGKRFILSRKDTGCPRSMSISSFDTEIIVPGENKSYQYLITGKSDYEEQIIITRILEEFFQQHVRGCTIEIVDISLSEQMKRLLGLLAADNRIEIKGR